MPTILVVDDNPSNFDVIADIFAHESPTLYYASSGQQALALMDDFPVDLVLLDVMMPEMDGVEVCHCIKSHQKWSFIPVVMVTALSDKEEMAFCLQSGADDFISKPINPLEIRARVRSMLRIKKQYDRLESVLHTRQNLANMIIHDLRNPLSSIMLSTEILKLSNLTEKQHHKVEQIYGSCRRLSLLMDNLLMVAKSEASSLVLDKTNIHLQALLEKTVAEFQNIAENHQVVLRLQTVAEDVYWQGDEGLIYRVIENLVSNAIRFSPTGGQVELVLQPLEHQKLQIQVRDQGTGMSDSLKAEILAPIADGQLLESSHRTGLGLSFCKMVIEAHQGQIFVQDNTPRGSIVTLVLEQPKNLNPKD